MKNLFLLITLIMSALNAEPSGAIHDAWSDWLLNMRSKDVDLAHHSEEDLNENEEDSDCSAE